MIHDELMVLNESIPSGLKPDFHALKGALWHMGGNVEFTHNSVRKRSGWSGPLTKIGTTPVRGLAQHIVSGIQYLFWGDQTDIYRWNTATVSAVGTSYTGNLNDSVTNEASIWSMVDWGTWILATNGKDVPQIYKGTSFAALGGTPPSTIRVLKKLGPYVLGFNTSVDVKEFVWCHADDVEQWVPSGANSAGSLIIRELNSRIIAVEPIGQNYAVYGTNSMAIVGVRSSPLYFGYTMALEGVGAIAQEAVVAVGRMNYGLGINGFWRTDGVSYSYIDEPAVKRYFFDDFNSAQKGKVNAYHNEARQEVVWYYPGAASSEPNKGIAFNYQTETWSFLSHGRTASLERSIYNYPVTALTNGDVYFENLGTNDNGDAMEAFIETKPIAFQTKKGFGLENKIKYVEAVQLGMPIKMGLIQFEVGTKMRLDEEEVTWNTFLVGDPSVPVYVRLSARWFIFRIKSEAVSANWEVQTMTVYGKVIGGQP